MIFHANTDFPICSTLCECQAELYLTAIQPLIRTGQSSPLEILKMISSIVLSRVLSINHRCRDDKHTCTMSSTI
jgi:hypothetical protein